MINAESAKTPLHVSFTRGTPFFFRNLDVEFEGGVWRGWPEMPGVVWWVMQRGVCGWREAWWRFARYVWSFI
ncbi:hypothetical protein BJ875DRAFT_467888 [Amylocarpus encephaloides]|uniref:Uncharacterized protein n=1 Tax=Amylocarpus encephaloides TaxID=45428 RepID=A0A9P7YFE6_9HELO|nr:hypothetical protein BJ875DRAFT_467888 [Amylocarpus encephaloides]